MRIPNAGRGLVPRAKIAEYLLSLDHPAGGSKARFFRAFGFRHRAWRVLSAALVEHAQAHDVASTEDSPFGTRYIIDGPIKTPDGRGPKIRAVWFIDEGATVPRFVTAHPLPRRSS